MAERSFAREVEDLKLGAGEEFRGEGILAITKALLECGVSYVAGYQGAPISHLMDVLSDAQDILSDLGVHFESSASEATAAATLAASVMYPIRGAVTFKAPVGINVASDALANLSSGGVTGGALVIIGEDYGEGSSIMQERSHAFAMKSQLWLVDPRPNVASIVKAVHDSFELSEASNTPVMLEVRIRACHVHGRFATRDNVRPSFPLARALDAPSRDTNRIVLPPASFLHEKEKIEQRWPAAVEFIHARGMNETFDGDIDDIGIIMQGGMYNGVITALREAGLADIWGETRVPLYVMNVTYPIVDREVIEFCRGKKAVLMVEEGQPEFIEQALHKILRNADIPAKLHGKDLFPMAGEYTSQVMGAAIGAFIRRWRSDVLPDAARAPNIDRVEVDDKIRALADVVPPRPPGFCTGCPERPIFSAMKLVEKELGPHHIAADIGCHLFSILPPFNIGATTMGYGLGPASASAFNVPASKRSISMMGDGGFWHNGLTSGVGNAVFNQHDGVIVVVDNYYSAATGGQDIPSSRADNRSRSTKHPIVEAVKGVGAKWVRQIDRTYDVTRMRDTLREALTTKEKGPKIIVASSECMLNKQRRVKPLVAAAAKRGERVVRERFGVDEDTCSGDHACIRLSGCPSLSVKPTSRSAEGQSGRRRRQYLRRLRPLRRGRGRRRAVPLLLPRRHRFQPHRVRSAARPHLAADDRRLAALAGGTADHVRAGGGMNVSVAPSSIALSQARPITVAVLAMGGQGGGVLVDWIVALAERRGWFAQSTSVPGVAQRTGATIYYIEMIAPDAEQARASPRAVADAGARQGRHRDRRRIDGSRPRHPARAGLARPHAVDRLLAPLVGRESRRPRPATAPPTRRRSTRRRMSRPTASSRSTWPRSPTPPAAWFPRCCSARSRAPAPCPSRQRILRQRSAQPASASMPACAPSPPAASGRSPRSSRIPRSSRRQSRRSQNAFRASSRSAMPITTRWSRGRGNCRKRCTASSQPACSASSIIRTSPMAANISTGWKRCRATRPA